MFHEHAWRPVPTTESLDCATTPAPRIPAHEVVLRLSASAWQARLYVATVSNMQLVPSASGQVFGLPDGAAAEQVPNPAHRMHVRRVYK